MKNALFTLLLLFLFSPIIGQDSLNMRVLFHWDDPTILPSPFIGNPFQEIWGWYQADKEKEYAILGSSSGIHFFDITDVENAYQCAYVPGRISGAIHRDFKNKDQYLFAVSDEDTGSLQIIDMSKLPATVEVIFDSDTFFQRSHNVWIEGNLLYTCVPRFTPTSAGSYYGLAIFDISDPANPSRLSAFPPSVYGDVHDLYTRNDTAWLNGSNDGLFVVDFSNPQAPVNLAHFQNYTFSGYNHSGWLSDDGKTYILADENHGLPLKVCDVSDLSDIEVVSYLSPGMTIPVADTLAIPHNPLILGDYVFTSYYYDGIYVFDISDPVNPTIAGFYDTYPDPNLGFYRGAWGVYPFLPSGHILASDMETGLYVLEFAPFVTSLEEDITSGLDIFPNPATDHLWIEAPSGLLIRHARILDLAGRTVFNKKFSGEPGKHQLNLPQTMGQGLYVLELETNKGVEARKLVKR